MKYELWYSVVVRDRHGKVVSRERRRSRSFLKQWNQLLYVVISGVSLSITDTGGTPRSVGPAMEGDPNFRMKAGVGVISYGIVVGTGDTAVAIDDYALGALIAEGGGAGQFNYQACTVADAVVSAPHCSYVASRAAVNNSGNLITVKESGIYVRADASYYLCAVRDVFGTPQDVPDGGSITVDFTLRVTV